MTRLDRLETWALTRAHTRAHRILQQGLADTGLTGFEYRVLVALADGNASSQVEIGHLAFLDRRDVTITLRGLQARALVKRQRDSSDSRRMVVRITAKGQQALRHADAAIQRVQDDVFAPLDRDERRTLLELLQRVAADRD